MYDINYIQANILFLMQVKKSTGFLFIHRHAYIYICMCKCVCLCCLFFSVEFDKWNLGASDFSRHTKNCNQLQFPLQLEFETNE